MCPPVTIANTRWLERLHAHDAGDHSHLLDRLSTVYSQLRGPARSSSSEDEGLPGITLLRTSSAGGSASVVGSPYSGHYGGGKVTRRWVTWKYMVRADCPAASAHQMGVCECSQIAAVVKSSAEAANHGGRYPLTNNLPMWS